MRSVTIRIPFGRVVFETLGTVDAGAFEPPSRRG